jgi:hypothetical protein
MPSKRRSSGSVEHRSSEIVRLGQAEEYHSTDASEQEARVVTDFELKPGASPPTRTRKALPQPGTPPTSVRILKRATDCNDVLWMAAELPTSRGASMVRKSHRGTLGDCFAVQRGTTYEGRLLGRPGPALLGLAIIQRNGGFRSDSLGECGGDSPDELHVQPGELYLSPKDMTQSADLLCARMKANLLVAATLTALRDTLLPMLISAEIRVPEAEEILEDAL